MKKVLFILGTRPEAIKLKPVIDKFAGFDYRVCLTNQHKEINRFLNIEKTKIIHLKLNRKNKGLVELTANILSLLDKNKIIKKWKPELIIVHGDTTSSFCGALYAFYEKIKLCHIESGLRTNDKQSPYPEEFNRKVIDYLSDINFCPTKINKKNLTKEKVEGKKYVVGNTIIDVLRYGKTRTDENIKKWLKNDEYILITMHRRENWDYKIKKILNIMNKFSKLNKKKIIYVCNNNKQLVKLAKKCFEHNKNVLICKPLQPEIFRSLLKNCSLVITDSGGVQEESCYYGKTTLIAREKTERVEAIINNCAKLIGLKNLEKQLNEIKKFNLKNKKYLYGRGNTSDLIVKLLSQSVPK